MKNNIDSLINKSTNSQKLQESDSERKLCNLNIEQNWSISANRMNELVKYKNDSHSNYLKNLADVNSNRLWDTKFLKKTFCVLMYFLLITILVTNQLQIANLKNRLSEMTSKCDSILNEMMLAKDGTSKLQYVIKKVK